MSAVLEYVAGQKVGSGGFRGVDGREESSCPASSEESECCHSWWCGGGSACGRRGGVLEVGFKGACKEVGLVRCVVRPVAVFVLEGGDGGW